MLVGAEAGEQVLRDLVPHPLGSSSTTWRSPSLSAGDTRRPGLPDPAMLPHGRPSRIRRARDRRPPTRPRISRIPPSRQRQADTSGCQLGAAASRPAESAHRTPLLHSCGQTARLGRRQAVAALEAKPPIAPRQQGILRHGANATKGRVVAEKETEPQEHRDGCVIHFQGGACKNKVADSRTDPESGCAREVINRPEPEAIVGKHKPASVPRPFHPNAVMGQDWPANS